MTYHQIRIKEEDIAKTTFTYTKGYYEFNVWVDKYSSNVSGNYE
jgi:hypothetical protein